jgi:hypothetical protein
MRLHRPRQHPSSSDMPRPSHPASRFVTIAHTPLLPRRDGARNAADLQARSTATDWHDGQISRSHQNAVKEIVVVIARSASDEAIQRFRHSGMARSARLGIHNHHREYRFRTAAIAASGMTTAGLLRRARRRTARSRDPMTRNDGGAFHSPTSFSHSSSVKTSTPCFFASASFEPAPGPATT